MCIMSLFEFFSEYRKVVTNYVQLKNQENLMDFGKVFLIIMLPYNDYLLVIMKMTPKWRKNVYVFDKSLFNIILFRNLHRV